MARFFVKKCHALGKPFLLFSSLEMRSIIRTAAAVSAMMSTINTRFTSFSFFMRFPPVTERLRGSLPSSPESYIPRIFLRKWMISPFSVHS